MPCKMYSDEDLKISELARKVDSLEAIICFLSQYIKDNYCELDCVFKMILEEEGIDLKFFLDSHHLKDLERMRSKLKEFNKRDKKLIIEILLNDPLL